MEAGPPQIGAWTVESAHRDGVADRERPRSDDVGVHGDTQLSGAAERLEPGGRRGDAVLSQVDGAAALDPLDDREEDRPTSWAPCAAASAISPTAFATLASRSRITGVACTAATRTTGSPWSIDMAVTLDPEIGERPS